MLLPCLHRVTAAHPFSHSNQRKEQQGGHVATSTTAGPDASGRNDLGRKGRRGTNGADKTENMHGSASAGETIASIDRAAGTSEPMIKQYAMMGHLSPEPPMRKQPESEAIAIIDQTISS